VFSRTTIEAQVRAASRKLLETLQFMMTAKLAALRKSKHINDPAAELQCEQRIAEIRASYDRECDRLSALPYDAASSSSSPACAMDEDAPVRVDEGAQTSTTSAVVVVVGTTARRVLPIERTGCELHFCSVCDTIYSNVRDANNPLLQRYYRHGLRNALRDYGTGLTYCKLNTVNHRGSCHDTVLSRVPLLGRRYALGKKVYQMCVCCSDIFVPDASVGGSCAYNDDGMMCCACTSAAARTRALSATPSRSLVYTSTGELIDRQCMCCQALTTTPVSTFMYPHGTVLCRHHHKPFMVKLVRNAIHELTSRELVRKCVIGAFIAHKENRRIQAQPQNNRRILDNRRKNNARR
jgi:hypothetical protein